jgi:hypothetical protein
MTQTTPRPLLTRIAFAFLWLFMFSLPLPLMTEFPVIGTVSKVTGLMAMAAGVAAVVARKQVRVMEAVHMTMGGFILWSAVTLCWSVNPQMTVQRMMTYLQVFVLVLLIWELCREERDVLQILGAFVLGTILPALSTLMAFLPGRQTLFARASSGVDPNNLAFLLALSLPVAYYLILREKGAISALYRLQMGFAACAILMSGSAVTMIATAIGLSLVCWTAHVVPVRTRLNAFVLLMLVGGTAMLFVPASLWQHLSEESRKGDITLTAVMNSGAEGLHTTPLGGFGAGSLSAAAGHSAARNPYFTLFAETGVVGFACFIAMLGVLFLAAERMSGTTKSFWFTVLGVYAVGVCGLNWECSLPAWFLFGLLAAHAACLKQYGVTEVERKQKENYYVEQGAEVWS